MRSEEREAHRLYSTWREEHTVQDTLLATHLILIFKAEVSIVMHFLDMFLEIIHMDCFNPVRIKG